MGMTVIGRQKKEIFIQKVADVCCAILTKYDKIGICTAYL